MFFEKLQKKLHRTCGTCTLCCQGYLKLVVRGQYIHQGNPCNYLSSNACSIYHERPSVCKEFKCLYLLDISIPEWMKPTNSNVIIYFRIMNNIPILEVMECGIPPSTEVLEWLSKKIEDKKITDIVIKYNSKLYHVSTNKEHSIKVKDFVEKYGDTLSDVREIPVFKERIKNLI